MYQKESLTRQPEIDTPKDKRISLPDFLEFLQAELTLLLSQQERVFVSLAGQSASGKSTIATKIQQLSTDIQVLNMDNYLLGWGIGQLDHDPAPGEMPYFAGLNPGVYDLNRFEADLHKLKLGTAISQPIFDEARKEIIGTTLFNSSQITVVDGIYTLDERFLHFADLAYLVEAPLHDRLIRKIFRNFCYHREDVSSIIKTYLTRDEPNYVFHQQRLESAANLIVTNPLNLHLEFQNMISLGWSSNDGRLSLQPKASAGHLSQGESIFIKTDQNQTFFAYAVDDNLLLKEPIENSTLELLMEYYTLS